MKKSEILKRLFPDNTIIISAVDGSKTIFNSKDIFKTWIDSDFEDWGLNKPGQKTPEIKTQVHEMVQNSNFEQMFGSLNDDLDKLCLTQHQIIDFCANNQEYLRENGRAAFFLFKVDSKYFVADVDVNSSGLYVGVRRFKGGFVWDAEDTHRLVVPQLEA